MKKIVLGFILLSKGEETLPSKTENVYRLVLPKQYFGFSHCFRLWRKMLSSQLLALHRSDLSDVEKCLSSADIRLYIYISFRHIPVIVSMGDKIYHRIIV